MILQERSPRLRRRLSAATHVLPDAGFTHIEPDLQQLAVNARRAPERFSRLIRRISSRTSLGTGGRPSHHGRFSTSKTAGSLANSHRITQMEFPGTTARSTSLFAAFCRAVRSLAGPAHQFRESAGPASRGNTRTLIPGDTLLMFVFVMSVFDVPGPALES
jgi:hypothetical protein